jgi:RNA polymerase sigma-70 factor (ECF subfamily)
MSELVETPSPRRFVPTAWTAIERARTDAADPESGWDHLYRYYFQPVCAYLCRFGHTREQAEELTQRFFAWLWEKDVVARAERSRGKFRNFLLTALKQFVERERRYQQAAKRAPGSMAGVSMGSPVSDHAAEVVDPHANSPERMFDRACAIELLQHTLDRLRAEYQRAAQDQRFEVLRGFLTGEPDATCDAAAKQLGISAAAVHVAVHRLRKRYGQLLREEIHAAAPCADVDDEVRALFRAVRGAG